METKVAAPQLFYKNKRNDYKVKYVVANGH